ncbi:hypothetical protein [Paenibacillus sp. UMB4589-SE434]|nr:hypothetical protein [Paenibacillus sp. UMB4589-SE434]
MRTINGIKRTLPFGSQAYITLGMVVEKLEEVQIRLLGEDELK